MKGSFRRLVVEPFGADLDAWEARGWSLRGSRMKVALALVRYNGLRATLCHRVAFWANQAQVPFLPTLLSQANIALHGIETTPSMAIGPGLYLPHTVGSVLTATSIGAGVTIQAGVTLGMRNEHAFPTIEDGVTISTGAKVLGGVRVGAGATIGANAVVIRDVPAGSTQVGVPARALADRPAADDTEEPAAAGLLTP